MTGKPRVPPPPRQPPTPAAHLRRALLVLGGLALALLLAFQGALAYLHTASGTARLLRLGLAAANGAIAGQVAASGATIQGNHVVVHGATLLDPEGTQVAFIEEVDVELVWSALLRGRLEARTVLLTQPSFTLALEPDGSNLDRTFAPRHPGPTDAAGGPSVPLTFVIQRFELTQGRLQVQTPEGPPLLLQGLGLTGSGRYALRSGDFQLETRGNGALVQPTPGPVTIVLATEHRGSRFSADVDVRAAGANVVADVRRRGGSALDGHLALDVAPNMARALVRGWPLHVPLSVNGNARAVESGFLVSLRAAAGRARLELQADVNLERALAQTVHVQVQHVDLAELLGRGPKSDLAFSLEGSGRGSSWHAGSGTLQLTLPPSRVRGEEVGPVELSMRLERGLLELSSLKATLPGVELSGSGRETSKSLVGTLQLDVHRLAALQDTFGEVLALPPLSGQGRVQLEVSGPPAHPQLAVEGHFATLAVGPFSAEGLELTGRLPDLTRLLQSNASVQASTLSLAGRSAKDVQATLRTEAQRVELQLTAAGPVRLELAGTADGDARGLTVDRLALEFPEETWTLSAPARLRFEQTRLQTETLELLSGHQSISLTGRLAQRHVEAAFRVTALDLARLPALAVPPGWQLAGTLDMTADVQGPEDHPDVVVRADWANGSWHGLRGVNAQLGARRTAERLALEGRLSAAPGTVELELEGPEAALRRRVHQPLTLHLKSAHLDVGQALCDLAKAGLWSAGCPSGTALVQAQLAARASVEGFADAPSLRLSLQATDVVAFGLPAREGALSLEGDEATPVKVTLSATGPEGNLRAEASLEDSGRLLARRRSWAGWRSVPLRATLQAEGLALAALEKALRLPDSVTGTASVRAELSGTLADPRGEAEVEVQKLVVSPWPEGEVHLSVQARDTVNARLTLSGLALDSGWVQAAFGAPLGRWWAASGEELAQATLELKGDLGPVHLNQLPLGINRLRRDRRLLDGQFRLGFEGHGTLSAPTLTATATATELGPSNGAHFEGTGQLRYADGRETLEVKLQSANGGMLALDAQLQLDLAWPAVRRGLHLSEAPLSARLHSEHFEPDFIASLLPGVRTISGKLQVQGQAGGTLGRPELKGALSWTDGAVGIIGFGLYQDIQLNASASNERFAIEHLSAKVQGGTFSLQLLGTRAADGFALSGELSSKDMPLIVSDQLLCFATLKAQLRGSALPWSVNLSEVNLSQADIQLPELRRKDLQDLSSPKDVVLTRNGVPLDRGRALRGPSSKPRRSGATAETPAAASGDFLKLGLLAPNHVFVRSQDVTLELGLSTPFRVALGEQLAVTGEVKIIRGRGDVWGRRFEIQPGGQVRFAGAPERALLNVTGVYSSVLTQAKVYMHFSGEAAQVKVTPSSDPPMSESEIYTLLATGRTSLVQSSLGSTSSVGGGEAGASILGSWAANQLKTAVGVAVPIDVLSVEVGNDERGVNQTRLEAGKYVNDDIYIGYQARTNADPFRYQNANAIRVEYRFLRRWSLQLEYGDANAGSLDAVWSRDY
ncbi:MAG: translocation/assembly module TamB domain-containing protein [Myxococcaceae bacterium]